MLVIRLANGVEFVSNVEDWMADQSFTEVFNFSTIPVGDTERKITNVLDSLVGKTLFGRSGIDKTVKMLAASKSQLVKGKIPGGGQRSLASAEGSTYDAIFKSFVEEELVNGELAEFKSILRVVPGNGPEPDVVMNAGPQVGWDLTTKRQVEYHINRDVFGRGYGRYYLLVWDEPRTESTRFIRQITSVQG